MPDGIRDGDPSPLEEHPRGEFIESLLFRGLASPSLGMMAVAARNPLVPVFPPTYGGSLVYAPEMRTALSLTREGGVSIRPVGWVLPMASALEGGAPGVPVKPPPPTVSCKPISVAFKVYMDSASMKNSIMARTEYPLAARQQAAQSLAALTQAGGPLEYLDKNTNVKVEGKGKEFLSRISATTPKDGFAFMTEIEFSGTMDGCRGQQVWLSEEWQFWSIAAPPKDIGAGGAVVHKRGDIDMPDATIPPKKRSDKHTAIMPTPASIYTFKSLRAQMTIPTDPVYADEQVLRCYDWEYEWTNMAKDGDKPAKEGKKMESAGDWGKAAGSVTITLKGEPPDKKCKV